MSKLGTLVFFQSGAQSADGLAPIRPAVVIGEPAGQDGIDLLVFDRGGAVYWQDVAPATEPGQVGVFYDRPQDAVVPAPAAPTEAVADPATPPAA